MESGKRGRDSDAEPSARSAKKRTEEDSLVAEIERFNKARERLDKALEEKQIADRNLRTLILEQAVEKKLFWMKAIQMQRSTHARHTMDLMAVDIELNSKLAAIFNPKEAEEHEIDRPMDPAAVIAPAHAPDQAAE